MNVFSSWFRTRREWRCSRLNSLVRVSDRQERVPGWRQDRISRAKLLIAGAGGLGGEIALGLARKGAGVVHIADPGIVDPPDLNRQIFDRASLYRPKAVEACRILSKRGFLGTRLVSHRCTVQDVAIAEIAPDVVICAVDNQIPSTRFELCRTCHKLQIPCVFCAVSTDADHGYVFVQVPGSACWECALRSAAGTQGNGRSCPGVPATIDILKTIAGIGLYAVDTLVMARERDWNYRAVSLSRSEFGGGMLVPRRPGCPVCGAAKEGK